MASITDIVEDPAEHQAQRPHRSSRAFPVIAEDQTRNGIYVNEPRSSLSSISL
jgi:hypothetical protein